MPGTSTSAQPVECGRAVALQGQRCSMRQCAQHGDGANYGVIAYIVMAQGKVMRPTMPHCISCRGHSAVPWWALPQHALENRLLPRRAGRAF